MQHHLISRLPEVEGEGDKPTKKKFKSYPPGYFHGKHCADPTFQSAF